MTLNIKHSNGFRELSLSTRLKGNMIILRWGMLSVCRNKEKQQLPLGEGFIICVLKDKLEFSRYKRKERPSREKGMECALAPRRPKHGMLGNK